jgi:hypothetical protein
MYEMPKITIGLPQETFEERLQFFVHAMEGHPANEAAQAMIDCFKREVEHFHRSRIISFDQYLKGIAVADAVQVALNNAKGRGSVCPHCGR